MTDLISNLGSLAIASRLKRLSDIIMQAATDVYAHHQIDFEPRCFPLFYYLMQNEQASIMEISEQLKLSHPAIILIARVLEKKGLIISAKSKDDGRKRLLKLSKKGKELMPKLQEVWLQLKTLNSELIDSQPHNFLVALKDQELVWQNIDYIKLYQAKYNV